MNTLFGTLLTLLSFSVNAEYRVYQYIVKNKVPTGPENQASYTVSTLNPRAYLAYHGGDPLITIDLLRTWICPGYTGKKETCKSPYKKLLEEALP